MVRRALASSRYFAALAVLGTFISSVVLIVSRVIAVVETAWKALSHPETDVSEAKHLAVDFIQLIDVFLLGTALYIISLGLYELFIGGDLPMPAWLRIRDFDDLEEKLIGVVIVLLSVTFLGSAVTWTGGKDILYLGVSIAVVIVAIALVLFVLERHHVERE